MDDLPGRHAATLAAVFAEPTRGDIEWDRDVVPLLLRLGATIRPGAGSRQRVLLNGIRAVFHRPHPRKEMNRGAVRSLRRFLSSAGIAP